jgi:hypothetical protein
MADRKASAWIDKSFRAPQERALVTLGRDGASFVWTSEGRPHAVR